MDQKKIAFFDIDKTIYNGYMIFPVAEYFFIENIIKKDTVDSLYQDLTLYRSGQIDYETTIENFNLHFSQGLEGQSQQVILDATTALVKTKEAHNFFSFAKPLFNLLRKTHDIYFVTGELHFVGEAVADYFSVHGSISTEAEVRDGLFTGKIRKSLARKEGKREAIESLFMTYPPRHSMAFGDSEGDIDMLAKAEHAFCINATGGLLEVASSRDWNIVTPDSVMEAVGKKLPPY